MFLRVIGRPLMAKVKQTTGIVGLDVVPNAREVLINLYTKTLKEIQVVPEDEGYRKAVESFTKHRLKVCQEEEDWEVIEKKLGCGQVEELIEEAQDELKLIEKMIGSYILYSISRLCTLILCSAGGKYRKYLFFGGQEKTRIVLKCSRKNSNIILSFSLNFKILIVIT